MGMCIRLNDTNPDTDNLITMWGIEGNPDLPEDYSPSTLRYGGLAFNATDVAYAFSPIKNPCPLEEQGTITLKAKPGKPRSEVDCRMSRSVFIAPFAVRSAWVTHKEDGANRHKGQRRWDLQITEALCVLGREREDGYIEPAGLCRLAPRGGYHSGDVGRALERHFLGIFNLPMDMGVVRQVGIRSPWEFYMRFGTEGPINVQPVGKRVTCNYHTPLLNLVPDEHYKNRFEFYQKYWMRPQAADRVAALINSLSRIGWAIEWWRNMPVDHRVR